jgi:mRNA interferase MazF
MRPSVICDAWDVVVVPFPFTERAALKRRPALVVSKKLFNRNGYSVMAMVTSAKHPSWPGDTPLEDHGAAGLRLPCTVRLKIFTMDNRLLLRKAGRLSAADRDRTRRNIQTYLA